MARPRDPLERVIYDSLNSQEWTFNTEEELVAHDGPPRSFYLPKQDVYLDVEEGEGENVIVAHGPVAAAFLAFLLRAGAK